MTGFTIVPELKKVPDTTDVRLYDTTDACIRDILAGRLDLAFLDAPTVAYLIKENPPMRRRRLFSKNSPAFNPTTSSCQP